MADAEENQEPQLAQEPEGEVPGDNSAELQADDNPAAVVDDKAENEPQLAQEPEGEVPGDNSAEQQAEDNPAAVVDDKAENEPQLAQEPEGEVPGDNSADQQAEDNPAVVEDKAENDKGKESTEIDGDTKEQEPVADDAGEIMNGDENPNALDDNRQAGEDEEAGGKENETEPEDNKIDDNENETGNNDNPVPDESEQEKEETNEENSQETESVNPITEQEDLCANTVEENDTDQPESQPDKVNENETSEQRDEENSKLQEEAEAEPTEGGAEEPVEEEKPEDAEAAVEEEKQAAAETAETAEGEAPEQSEEKIAEDDKTPEGEDGGVSAEQTVENSTEEDKEGDGSPRLSTEDAGSSEKLTAEQGPSQEELGETEEQEDEGEEQIVPPDMPSEEPTQDELVQEKTEASDDPAPTVEQEALLFQQEVSMDQPGATPDQDFVPPPPHLPSPERSHTTIEGQMSTSALNIVWSFGLNRNVPVLNLSDGVREAIMYPCAHVGIMYDFKNNKQHTLQAHLNPITCSAISQDKRWLVTGDVGPDAMVNIWDTYTGIPIQTMFDPNAAGGVVAVAFTPDSRYLATMSALPVQTLAIWDWTVDGDVPICSSDLKPEFGVQNFIYFDPTDIHHLVANSESQVLFFHWEEHCMEYFAPPLSDSDFNKPVGRYTQSLFQMGIARALTATSIGNLVVWDNNRPLSSLYVKPEVYVWTGHPIMDVNQSADKKALKIIKVHDKGINVLTTTDKYIVLGDTAGHVKFFDQGLRLIYWYQDFNTGPCTAISFAYMPDFEAVPNDDSVYPSDATKQAKPFIVRNFIVGTAIAVYGNMTTDGSKFKIIHREHDAAVHALASHPKLPIIAIGSYSGLLKLWNYKTKETVGSKMFEKTHIQTVAFDPKGFFIVVGCTNGSVYILDSVALLEQMPDPYRYAREAITHIAFSHNSVYFATADAGHTITVYKRQKSRKEMVTSPYIWHGRYRSHYKPIRDLLFDVYLDTNQPKLLSLGEDRMLIEYELSNPGKNHVIPKSEDRIEQSAVPRCMCLYPPITKEHFLFTANDEYKLKCYNSTTKMCRKTVLGPTYGSAISKMVVVPTTSDESSNRFLAYITEDKVGLHILPASGNPHLAMALIAHPSGVSNIECSHDGAYLFTAGGPDYAVHMWEINLSALEAQAKLGGEDLVPFYGLLEGGRDGDVFAELEDLFYYAQLRHQGINSMETREIGNRVPITEVPYIMRAMGFYPSEQEIEDMLNEIKYDDFVLSGQYQVDIDLGQFIKLYVNHRPAFGLAPDKLIWAFKTLADSPELGRGGVIERGDLLDILQKKGEHMTEMELAEHLTTLLGFNREGGTCEQEAFDAEQAGNFIAENLPYDINAEIMVNEILGFSLTQDPPGVENVTDMFRSGAT